MSRIKEQNSNKNRVIDENTPLMVLAGPMFLEMLLNILVNNVDTLMLSHYSEIAVGAVGNANQVMFLLILLFNIIATSTSIVVAQYLGAKKYDRMNIIYTLSFIVNIAFGVFLSGIFVMSGNGIMKLLKVPAEMVPDALTYINIVGGTMFLMAGYNVMLQILRCNGYAKIGTYISIIINLINIVGNYMFLYGPWEKYKLGVAGVAIPTAFSRFVALVCAVIFFLHKKIGKISIKYLYPFPGNMLFELVRIGLPSAGENVSYNIYQLVLLSFINSMGYEAVNAKVYCNSLTQFVMVFSNNAAMATQIIVGHLVGAGKVEAAFKRAFSTLKISMPITIGLSVANVFLSPYSLKLFTNNEQIIKLGFFILLVDIVIEIGRCLNMTFVSSLKAAGDYMFPLIVGLCTMWGIGVSVGYICGVVMGLGVAGVFIGTASDEFIRGLIVLRRWVQKKWTGKSLIDAAD